MLRNDEEILSRIIERNGGHLSLPILTDLFRGVLNLVKYKWDIEFENLSKDKLIPSLSRSIFQSIRFSYVKDWSFNAFTSGETHLNVIALHAGLPIAVQDAFMAAFSDPSICPDIGNSLQENFIDSDRQSFISELRQLMAGKHDDKSYNFQKFKAKDKKRRVFALQATNSAIEFIVFHAISHIVRGHVDYLHLRGRDALIPERRRNTEKIFPSTLMMPALEMDADYFATRFRSRSINIEWIRRNKFKDIYEYLHIYLFAIGSVLSLFELESMPTDTPETSPHPRPEVVRIFVALKLALHFAKEMFQLPSKSTIMVDFIAREDISQFRKWLGLVPSTISAIPSDQMEMKLAQLNSIDKEPDMSLLKSVKRLHKRIDALDSNRNLNTNKTK